jgi:hypothetical protein
MKLNIYIRLPKNKICRLFENIDIVNQKFRYAARVVWEH